MTIPKQLTEMKDLIEAEERKARSGCARAKELRQSLEQISHAATDYLEFRDHQTPVYEACLNIADLIIDLRNRMKDGLPVGVLLAGLELLSQHTATLIKLSTKTATQDNVIPFKPAAQPGYTIHSSGGDAA
jgi:hypothetical protein